MPAAPEITSANCQRIPLLNPGIRKQIKVKTVKPDMGREKHEGLPQNGIDKISGMSVFQKIYEGITVRYDKIKYPEIWRKTFRSSPFLSLPRVRKALLSNLLR